MTNWFRRLFRIRRARSDAARPVAQKRKRYVNCDRRYEGGLHSFNWEYAHNADEFDEADLPNPEAFSIEQSLRAGTLFRCQHCQSAWYLDPNSEMMNWVSEGRVPLLLQWSAQLQPLSADSQSILAEIGQTPHDIYGNGSEYEIYPCAVHTQSGKYIPVAIVSKQRHAPFETYRNYRLGSEIASIEKSPLSLPFDVRVATSQSEEVRMGFAPTILETPDGRRLTANWTTNFLDFDGVDPMSVKVASEQNYFADSPPIIEEPEAVYFIVDI